MTYKDHLAHYGIKKMKWGKRNGPPYPLTDLQRSAEEVRENPTSESAKRLARIGEKSRFNKTGAIGGTVGKSRSEGSSVNKESGKTYEPDIKESRLTKFADKYKEQREANLASRGGGESSEEKSTSKKSSSGSTAEDKAKREAERQQDRAEKKARQARLDAERAQDRAERKARQAQRDKEREEDRAYKLKERERKEKEREEKAKEKAQKELESAAKKINIEKKRLTSFSRSVYTSFDGLDDIIKADPKTVARVQSKVISYLRNVGATGGFSENDKVSTSESYRKYRRALAWLRSQGF